MRFYTTNEKKMFTANALSPREEVSQPLNIRNYDADGDITFKYIGPDEGKKFSTGNLQLHI